MSRVHSRPTNLHFTFYIYYFTFQKTIEKQATASFRVQIRTL